MATFVATPMPTQGAVLCALTGASTWDGASATITRVIDGGAPVEVRPQAGPITIGGDTSGTYNLIDYDVPTTAAGLSIVYTLTLVAPDVGTITAAAVSFTPGPTVLPWTFPEKVLPISLITGFRQSRATTDQVHNILGAENPAITIGDGRPASGSMDLWTSTLTDALALENLLMLDALAKGGVYLLRGPVGDPLRVFFKPSRVEVSPAKSDGGPWMVSVEFTTMPTQTSARG